MQYEKRSRRNTIKRICNGHTRCIQRSAGLKDTQNACTIPLTNWSNPLLFCNAQRSHNAGSTSTVRFHSPNLLWLLSNLAFSFEPAQHLIVWRRKRERERECSVCACVETYWQIHGLRAAQADLLGPAATSICSAVFLTFINNEREAHAHFLSFHLIEINQLNKSLAMEWDWGKREEPKSQQIWWVRVTVLMLHAWCARYEWHSRGWFEQVVKGVAHVFCMPFKLADRCTPPARPLQIHINISFSFFLPLFPLNLLSSLSSLCFSERQSWVGAKTVHAISHQACKCMRLRSHGCRLWRSMYGTFVPSLWSLQIITFIYIFKKIRLSHP